MADVVPDGEICIDDMFTVAMNFGNSCSYSTDLAGVAALFSTGHEVTPINGYVSIPYGALDFTVARNGNPIGATSVFWGR